MNNPTSSTSGRVSKEQLGEIWRYNMYGVLPHTVDHAMEGMVRVVTSWKERFLLQTELSREYCCLPGTWESAVVTAAADSIFGWEAKVNVYIDSQSEGLMVKLRVSKYDIQMDAWRMVLGSYFELGYHNLFHRVILNAIYHLAKQLLQGEEPGEEFFKVLQRLSYNESNDPHFDGGLTQQDILPDFDPKNTEIGSVLMYVAL